MIQLNYINKDILQAFEEDEINVILHQCNCTVGMGAGLAKKIADKYPQVNDFDKIMISNCKDTSLGIIKFGYADLIKLSETKHIWNIYSQWYKGSPSNNTFISVFEMQDSFINRIIALKIALKNVRANYHFKRDGDLTCETIKIGIPLIASGLAKQKEYKYLSDLDYFKKFIEPIIIECFDNKIEELNIYYL